MFYFTCTLIKIPVKRMSFALTNLNRSIVEELKGNMNDRMNIIWRMEFRSSGYFSIVDVFVHRLCLAKVVNNRD